MYPITLKRGEAQLTFPTRRDMVVWLLHNFTSPIVLIVGPAYYYYLDATVVGGVVVDMLDEEVEHMQCWAVTESGYHKIEYRDADGCMIADVGQPKDSYYPGGRDDRGNIKKGKRARNPRARKGVVQGPRDPQGDRLPVGPVGQPLDRAQAGQYELPGGGGGAVRAKGARARRHP